MDKKLTVGLVIPVYNEEKTIVEVLDKVDSLSFIHEIVVVDDCSTDRSWALISAHSSKKIKATKQSQNGGKTAALKTGFQLITSDICIVQDADLEYDPEELTFVIDPILKDRADVVYGSRFLVRKAQRVLYFYHFIANKGLTFICNLFTNKNMTDIETCYKAFRSELIKTMPISSSGFGFEVEVTAKISRTRARIYEVPISYYGRTYEDGKKIKFSDGLWALYYILRYNLFSSSITRSYVEQANQFLAKSN